MDSARQDYAITAVRQGVLIIDRHYLETGEPKLFLKDKRRALYFWNAGNLCTGSSVATMGNAYASAIFEKLTKGEMKDFNIIFGPAYKGIPIAVAAAQSLSQDYHRDKGWAFRRKEAKDVGEKGFWVGMKPQSGYRILMVDDVISSAATKFTELEEIRKYAEHEGLSNVEVTGLQISLDREQTAILDGRQLGIGAAQYFTDETGIPCDNVFGAEELMNFLHEEEIIGNDGEPFITDKFMIEFEKYQNEFGTIEK